MRRAVIALNILIVVVTVLAYYSPVISPLKFWPAAFAGLIFPVLLFMNVAFILLWLSFRKKWFLLSLVCLIAGWNRIGEFMHFRFPDPEIEETQDSIIHIASFNALKFYRLYPQKKGFRDRLKGLMQEITTGQPLDIFCVQEAVMAESVRGVLDFPHRYRIDNSPVYVLSRFPISNTGSFDFGDPGQYCGWADISTSQGMIRVYNLHLYSNLITNEAEQLMEERNFKESQTWYNAGEILRRYRKATVQRSRQAKIIGKHIKESPYPVIVCGDFNDVPLSYVYHQIKGSLEDSFEACGAGIGATYNGRIPGLRIDHILAGSEFEFLSHSVIKGNYSDHFPIVSKIRFKEM